MVRIGIVGIGFMGMIHYLAARSLRGATVTAICSRDPNKLAGDWRSIRGNFGPPGAVMDLGTIHRHQSIGDLLADAEVDLVDLCTPTDQHAATAIAALRAGKHVLVEKAIALTTEQADEMLAVARQTGKLLMVAHVLPFFPEFAFLAQAVSTQAYGPLLGGHWTRVISRPDWSLAIGDAAVTGGPAVDLHIHDTHFIGLLCGLPQRVRSLGRVESDGSVSYLVTHYDYGPTGPVVSCASGAIAQKGRPFVHGFEVYCQHATLTYHSSGSPLTVWTADGHSEHPTLPGSGDPLAAFTSELQAAVEGVEAGREPALVKGPTRSRCPGPVFARM